MSTTFSTPSTQQQNTRCPSGSLEPGARVRTPAGIGTLEAVADVLKRDSTEIESVAALVFVNGKRAAFDVSDLAVL